MQALRDQRTDCPRSRSRNEIAGGAARAPEAHACGVRAVYGKTVEQLREDYLPDAKKNLLRQQVIAEIAQIEKIEADEQSVADAITALCRENGMTIDQLQPYMTDEFRLQSSAV